MKIAKYLNYKRLGLNYEPEPDMKKEIGKHRLIRISMKDSILLFLHLNC